MENNVKECYKNTQAYANTRTTGKEQYYTTPEVVDLCLSEVQKHISLEGKTILEPCGGTGEFIKGLQRIGIPDSNIISFDIEPKHPLVQKGDYLEKEFKNAEGLISITNPPFGRASSLAKRFFNHAATHCDYICYIVPKAWRKWTTFNSLDNNFHLIADIEMPQNCFYLPDEQESGQDVLNTVFQIWQRKDTKRKKITIPDHKLIKKIIPNQKKVTAYRKIKTTLYEKTDDGFVEREGACYEKVKVNRPDFVKGANFEIIVFGHSCGSCKEITEPKVDAKTTTMYLHIEKQEVKDALKQIDYSKYYNNVSYVKALSIQEINYELNEWFGLKNFTDF